MSHTIATPLRSAVVNDFYLTSMQAKCLDKYYILHWTGAYLKSQSDKGIIRHQDIDYIVVLPDHIRTKVWAAHQLKLSFRLPRAELNIPPHVLIRFL